MAAEANKKAKDGLDKSLEWETHYVSVPRLGDVVFAVKSTRRLLPNGRFEYEMTIPPAGRTLSFARRLIHVDEFGSSSYTYYGDGVISSWDWTKDKRGSGGVIY